LYYNKDYVMEGTNAEGHAFASAKGAYFYEWDFSEEFCVTSNNVGTQNQLRLVNEISGGIRLKDVNMILTDKFKAEAVGRKLNGTILENLNSSGLPNRINGVDCEDYANIVIDNSTTPKYEVSITVEGENTLGAIFQSTYQGAAEYCGSLYINGTGKDTSKLTLGTICGAFAFHAKNLSIYEYDTNFEYLVYTNTKGYMMDTIDFENCYIDAPSKRLYCGYQYIYFRGDSEAYVGSLMASYEVLVQGKSYVRVYGDVNANIYAVDLSDSASMVVDGNIISASYHGSYGEISIATSGYLIVKGNILRASSVSVSNKAKIIANTITSSKNWSQKESTIIANQIINSPLATTTMDQDGNLIQQLITEASSNCKTNGDNYPYYTYSNEQESNSTYKFSNGNLYLLGNYDVSSTTYDLNKVLWSQSAGYTEGDPVADILKTVLDDKGDLLPGLRSNASSEELNETAKAAVENQAEKYGKDVTKHECIQLGNSTYVVGQSGSRVATLSGTKVYAAGNITFFNDTTVTGGSVYCGGTFGSKRDLTISGGVITAKEVGNAYNCTTVVDGLTRYAKLHLVSGTINADHIGALSLKILEVPSKSVVAVEKATVIKANKAAAIQVESDLYINYLYDQEIFTVKEEPRDLVFTATLQPGNEQDFSGKLSLSDEAEFSDPSIKNSTDEYGQWAFDQINGTKVSTISASGYVNGASADGYVYSGRDSIALYAIKGTYDLLVAGDYGTGFTVQTGNTTLTQNGSGQVAINQEVSIQLRDADMLSKTVVWYMDGAGKLHNVLSEATSKVDEANHIITFTMPCANVEIWITSELNLYLDLYEISFTETGFAVELPSKDRRADSIFEYAGNICVTQKATDPTFKQMQFETAEAGNVKENDSLKRTIRLKGIDQRSTGTVYGTIIPDGTNVHFLLDGTNGIAPIELTENSTICLEGNSLDDITDVLKWNTSYYLGTYRGIGNGSGQSGAVTFKNLTLRDGAVNYSRMVTGSSESTNSVDFIGCVFDMGGYYTYDRIVHNMGTVSFTDCTMNIVASPDQNQKFVDNCDNMVFNNTTFTYLYGGSRDGTDPFQGITGTIEINNSSVDIQLRQYADASVTHKENPVFTGNVVLNDSTMTVDHRWILRSLSMKGNSTLTIDSKNEDSNEGFDGYLLCPDIVIADEAVLNAGYIILSGFNTQQVLNKDQVLANLKLGTVLDGAGYRGLVMNGGKINASEFIGGDVNAKLNINGGVLNAPRIGTYGALFGYARYIPNQTETEFVYQYAKLPSQGTVVNVSGGTVNVLSGAASNSYIGGMNAVVNISGGTINLNNGTVLGVTETQKQLLLDDASSKQQTLENAVAVNINGGIVSYEGSGSISAPYGSVSISGTDTTLPTVHVANMTAEKGTICIENANKGLANMHTQGTITSEIGVRVDQLLSAQNLSILHGAYVCAREAYAEAAVGETGSFTVDETSYLCTDTYGVRGGGEFEISLAAEKIYGKRTYAITYVLNSPTKVDIAFNDADNPTQYVQEAEGFITLKDPTCTRYNFLGWYDNPQFTGEKITTLSRSVAQDYTLYAKWEPKQVEFEVTVHANHIDGNLADEVKSLVENGQGTLSTDETAFTFKKTFSVPYLATVSSEYLNFEDYRLKSYDFIEFSIDEDALSGLVTHGSVITAEWMDYYLEKGEPISLSSTQGLLSRVALTLDMNLDNDRPINAQFDYITEPEEKTGTTITSRAYVNKTLKDAAGFVDANGALIKAAAPGYQFGGWFIEKDCTGTSINSSYVVTRSGASRFYAKWTPNTYNVEFDGNGGIVTLTDTIPNANDTNGVLAAKVVYDTVIDGNIIINSTSNNQLPYSWKEGYVFLGWKVVDTEITSDTELNLTDIPGMNVDVSKSIRFEAQYRKVDVTYNLNGGEWTENEATSNPDFGAALAGYTKNPESLTADQTIVKPVETNGATYGIVSTTSSYFEKNDQYVTNDYRHVLMNKGYTFQGWNTKEDGTGEWIATLPKYQDVEVYAQWSANEYSLILRPEGVTPEESKYSNYVNTVSGTAYPSVSVTVGQEIIADKVIGWPDRSGDNAWYAYNSNIAQSGLTENQKRFILGFSFDWQNPGSTDQSVAAGYSIYQNYGVIVNKLINTNTLFTKSDGSAAGSVFSLPADEVYGETHIHNTTTVPDYPTGSNIDMYAVYRERSLVFVERIVKADGSVSQMVMHSAPWSVYSDYPWETYPQDKYKSEGYTLVKWGVNGYDANSDPYPKDAETYENELESYKTKAKDLGTYDIMVYTIYAAQANVTNIVLQADKDPTKTNPTATFTYTLPGSMNAASLSYQISSMADGLTLVSGTEEDNSMDKNLYNNSGYADNTVAIEMLLYAPGEQTPTWSGWLTESKTPIQMSEKAATASWKIVLNLYHSKVMTKDSEFTFDINFGFEGMADQSIVFEDVKVKLVPSEYTVVYTVVEPEDDLIASTDWNWKQFDQVSKTYTAKVNYGSALLEANGVPELVGYTADGNWTYNNSETRGYGGLLTLPVSATNNGIVNVTTQYNVNEYTLSADSSNVLDKWTVVYSDATELDADGATLPYHTKVTFKPKEGASNAYAEFVTLQIGDVKTTLDQVATLNQDGSYTFYMPANNVHASYDDVMELYLEKDTIDIHEGYYNYLGKQVIWRGNYVILMDEHNNVGEGAEPATTENVLKLNGNLSGRSIKLGNLGITSKDSISLSSGTTAILATDYTEGGSIIAAKNINVPESASLTMAGTDAAVGKLTLTPDTGAAAIGGNGKGNGVIILDNLQIDMTLPAGSYASGIGSGNQIDQGSSVTLNKCVITVEETAVTGKDAYKGAWIGGAGVTAVNISDTQIYAAEGTAKALGPKVTDGDTVTLSGVTVGTSDNPVANPVEAANLLEIKNTVIYQNLASGAPIGTDATGKINVTKSSIEAAVGQTDALYTGQLLINDAASDVMIANTQILDINNGDIQINSANVTQGSETHAHSSNYLLISEFANAAANDLTVESLTEGATITIKPMTLTDVTVEESAKANVVIDGTVTLAGKINIEDGATLDVRADANDVVALTGAAGYIGGSNGTYKQTGGTLTSTNNMEGENLTVELDGVTATIPSLIVKDLTLEEATVTATATDGKVGSGGKTDAVTNVRISNSTVNAGTIGALGNQNETFTFVTLEGSNTLTGKLVQDHYRLTYVLEDTNFVKQAGVPVDSTGTKLDTVFRTETSTDGVVTAMPAVPADPKFNGDASYFETWYLLDETERIALTNRTSVDQFSSVVKLNTGLIELAEAEEADGTRTLIIYSAMKVRGSGVITKDRQFDTFDSSVSTITVLQDDAWTAKFAIEGAVVSGGDYRFKFDQALPSNTKLTLVQFKSGSTVPKYYHYTVTGNDTTSVSFSSFKLMGGTTAPVVGESGTEMNDVYLLAADFSQANAAVTTEAVTVTFEIGQSGSTSAINVASVSYNLALAPAAAITADIEKVTVDYTVDTRLSNKNLYLVAQIKSGSLPYGASANITNSGTTITGKILGGDLIVFDLGSSQTAMSQKVYSYQLNGLNAGEYDLTWHLTAAKSGNDNVFDQRLASSNDVKITVTETAPSMKVTLQKIDGSAASSRVLKTDTAHELTFDVVTNVEVESITAEKQGILASFNTIDGMTVSAASENESGTYTVTLPATWAEGTYRIRFSCTADEQQDDKYFTVILETE